MSHPHPYPPRDDSFWDAFFLAQIMITRALDGDNISDQPTVLRSFVELWANNTPNAVVGFRRFLIDTLVDEFCLRKVTEKNLPSLRSIELWALDQLESTTMTPTALLKKMEGELSTSTFASAAISECTYGAPSGRFYNKPQVDHWVLQDMHAAALEPETLEPTPFSHQRICSSCKEKWLCTWDGLVLKCYRCIIQEAKVPGQRLMRNIENMEQTRTEANMRQLESTISSIEELRSEVRARVKGIEESLHSLSEAVGRIESRQAELAAQSHEDWGQQRGQKQRGGRGRGRGKDRKRD